MTIKWFYGPVILGAIFLIVGNIVNPMGSLMYFILSATGILIEGITFLIIAIGDLKIEKKSAPKNKRSKLLLVLVSCACILFGGKNLISVCMDLNQGAIVMELSDCSIGISRSRRRIFNNYKLIGIDSRGEKKTFRIDYETYQKYTYEIDFDVKISAWEHSEVIKEIY